MRRFAKAEHVVRTSCLTAIRQQHTACGHCHGGPFKGRLASEKMTFSHSMIYSYVMRVARVQFVELYAGRFRPYCD